MRVSWKGAQPGRSTAALDDLAQALGSGAQRRAPLAPFTAMRVGGPADLLVVVESLDELADAVREARRFAVPYWVLGGGCNVLIADQGLRGLVIINRAASMAFQDDGVRVASGVKLTALARRTVENCLTGMAWAAGLPGTVGGAVVSNAGAFGGEIADTLCSAAVLEPDGAVVERGRDWFDFAYRDSRLKREATRERSGDAQRVVLSVSFQLEAGDGAALQARFDEVLAQRRARQPSGSTMGSTFKNPPERYAGQLIDKAGLKGYRIGAAMISEVHANFFVNLGGATAADVLALIRHAQAEVERQFGVELALEIELLGWQGDNVDPVTLSSGDDVRLS